LVNFPSTTAVLRLWLPDLTCLEPLTATALPTISSTFGDTSNIGWYGSAYLLAQMASQPVFGKIYTCFEPKRTYLVSLLIFGLGSILCAASPISECLILGRAVTGIAAAGLLTGSL
jgi:MFS family permease